MYLEFKEKAPTIFNHRGFLFGLKMIMIYEHVYITPAHNQTTLAWVIR